MSANDQTQGSLRQSMKRRAFLQRAGWGSVGVTGLIMGVSRSRVLAHPPSPYPSWIPPSNKPPKRGGILTRVTATDPPVLDPRLTNSVGLFQMATLAYNRLLRYPFADEARDNKDLTLKGDLAVAREDIDLAGVDMGAMENFHIQAISRATFQAPGEAPQEGVGVFEQLILGPYRPYALG